MHYYAWCKALLLGQSEQEQVTSSAWLLMQDWTFSVSGRSLAKGQFYFRCFCHFVLRVPF